MWQPRFFGTAIGWLTIMAIAVHFLQDDLIRYGWFGDACKLYGIGSWSCGVSPKMIVWLPNMFVYLIAEPFAYNGGNDWFGTEYVMLWTASPIAYFLALIATNYWVWKLNQM